MYLHIVHLVQQWNLAPAWRTSESQAILHHVFLLKAHKVRNMYLNL